MGDFRLIHSKTLHNFPFLKALFFLFVWRESETRRTWHHRTKPVGNANFVMLMLSSKFPAHKAKIVQSKLKGERTEVASSFFRIGFNFLARLLWIENFTALHCLDILC